MDYDATEQLNDLARLPPPAVKPPPKWNGWSAIPRALGAAASEIGAATGESLKAFGQVLGAAGTDSGGGIFATQSPTERRQSEAARQQIATVGTTGESEASRSLRNVSDYYAPDPVTAGKAEQLVFGLTRGVSKAVAYGVTTGPAAPFLFGLDEGLTQTDQLQRQGVDTRTAVKAGAVAGAVNAAGFLIPVAGSTVARTFGLATLSGPASYIAQQAATREILRAAKYDAVAESFDPFDPTGLAVSMLPFGFGAWAARSHLRLGKASDVAHPSGVAEPRPSDVGRGDGGPQLQQHGSGDVPADARGPDAQALDGNAPAGDGPGRSPDAVAPRAPVEPPPFEEAPAWLVDHEAVDAAMVHNLTMAADHAELPQTPRDILEAATAERRGGQPVDSWLDSAHYGNGLLDAAEALGIDVPKPLPHKSKMIEMIREAIGGDARVAAEPKFVDTRGQGQRFHGTGRAIAALSDEYAMVGDSRNIYGSGFYTTDAVDISAGYMRKGGKESALYDVQQKDVKLYDMEAPLTPETEAMVRGAMGHDFPTENGDTGAPLANLREIYDEFRRESQGNGLSRNAVQDVFDSIRHNLEQQGYRGFEHVGGGHTGNQAHNVRIFWHPEQDVTISPIDLGAFKKEITQSVPTTQELGAQARETSRPEAAPQGQADRADTPAAAVPAEPAGRSADPLTQSVRERADRVVAEVPDMIVGTREDGSPISAREALEQIRREAAEGTDAELGGQDAPLLDVAIQCALSQGE